MNHDRRPPKSSDSGGQSTVPKDLQSIAEEPGAVARSSTQQRLVRLRVDRLSSIADMAVALTHEVTQPLTAAANLVSAARRLVGGDAPDALAALDKAEAQMVRAGRMIGRLREFIARSEPETVEQSLHKVIRDASELAAPALRDADVNLTFRLGAVADLVLVDRVEIEQALVNLLRYALEAVGGSPGRTVTIATSVANGFIQTDIVDAAAEFAETAEPNSSQPLNPTGVRRLGDGLSVARSIIDAHGGRVVAGDHEYEGVADQVVVGEHALAVVGTGAVAVHAGVARRAGNESRQPAGPVVHDRRLDLAGAHELQALGRVGLPQQQRQLGVGPQRAGERGRERDRGGRERGHHDSPRRLSGLRRQVGLRFLDHGEDPFRVHGQHAAGGGQPGAARCPVEQRRPRLPFQDRQLLRYRRGRVAERLSGPRDAAPRGEFVQHTEPADIKH